eukprot:1506501-Rhodomonas_salina.2
MQESNKRSAAAAHSTVPATMAAVSDDGLTVDFGQQSIGPVSYTLHPLPFTLDLSPWRRGRARWAGRRGEREKGGGEERGAVGGAREVTEAAAAAAVPALQGCSGLLHCSPPSSRCSRPCALARHALCADPSRLLVRKPSARSLLRLCVQPAPHLDPESSTSVVRCMRL